MLLHWRRRRDIVQNVASEEEINQAIEDAARVRRERQENFVGAHGQADALTLMGQKNKQRPQRGNTWARKRVPLRW